MDALTCEGEAPARVLSPRRFERCHGIRIQGNAAAVPGLRRAVIEPGHLAVKIHAAPFKAQDLTRSTTGREHKLHDRLHMLRQGLDQSIRLLAPQESHAPPGFLQHPNLWNPFEPSPVLMRDIQYSPNHLECAIDRRVRDTIFYLAIPNERLQHRHVDRIQLRTEGKDRASSDDPYHPRGSSYRRELLNTSIRRASRFRSP